MDPSFRWALFVVCALSHFYIDVFLGMWSLFKTVSGVNVALAGIAAGLGAFFGEIFELYFGALSDRGYRFLLMGLGVLCATLMAWSPSFPHNASLFFCAWIVALGSSMFHPGAAGYISVLFPERRASMVSLFWAFGTLGIASSQLIVYPLWQLGPQTFSLLALPAVIFIPLYAMLFWKNKTQTNATPSAHFSFWDAWRSSHIRLLWASQVCLQSLYWGLLFYLPDLLEVKGYQTYICCGLGNFVYVLSGAVGAVLFGYLADRFEKRAMLLQLTCVAGVLLYAFILLPPLSEIMALSWVACAGAILGATHPIAVAWGQEMYEGHPSFIAAVLMGGVWCVSELLGMAGLGTILTLFPQRTFLEALALWGGVVGLGFFFLLLIPSLSRIGGEENV